MKCSDEVPYSLSSSSCISGDLESAPVLGPEFGRFLDGLIGEWKTVFDHMEKKKEEKKQNIEITHIRRFLDNQRQRGKQLV